MEVIDRLRSVGLAGLFEILVLAAIFYYMITLFRGTRGAPVLVGLLLFFVAMFGLTQAIRLEVLGWLLRYLSAYFAVALIIIFQPELRRALAELGSQNVFGSSARERDLVDHIVGAAKQLSERRIGCLIAVERETGTRIVQETGTKLDCAANADLLGSIFVPNAPLHDGGVIISGERLVAAGCLFPLAANADLGRGLGTRHRAAVGLSEETDAVVVVVSEETGGISVALQGRLIRPLTVDALRDLLADLLVTGKRTRRRMRRAKESLVKGIQEDSEAASEESGSAG